MFTYLGRCKSFWSTTLLLFMLLTGSSSFGEEDVNWFYSYELERENKRGQKLSQYHKFSGKGSSWNSAVEYRHESQNSNNSEELEWKQAYRWLDDFRYLRYEISHDISSEWLHFEEGKEAEAQLAFSVSRKFRQTFQLKAKTKMDYFRQNKVLLYKHSGKVEVEYYWFKRRWQHSWLVDLKVSRNIQQENHYRLTGSELSYRPKVRLSNRNVIKLQLGLSYHFIDQIWFVSNGFKLTYRI